jgi:hypothetical protein
LYGSQKPNHEPYKLKYVYNVSVDSVDQEFEIVEELDISKYNSVEGMKKIRQKHEKRGVVYENDFIDEYTKRKGRLSKQNTVVSNYADRGRVTP